MDTDHQNDNIIHNIEEDIKMNGWRKWLAYLKFYFKYKKEMYKEDLQDTRDKIEYNYKKEEGYIN